MMKTNDITAPVTLAAIDSVYSAAMRASALACSLTHATIAAASTPRRLSSHSIACWSGSAPVAQLASANLRWSVAPSARNWLIAIPVRNSSGMTNATTTSALQINALNATRPVLRTR